jgi:hypothetical protein
MTKGRLKFANEETQSKRGAGCSRGLSEAPHPKRLLLLASGLCPVWSRYLARYLKGRHTAAAVHVDHSMHHWPPSSGYVFLLFYH